MKLCCVIHSANKEAIDFILAASAFMQEITVILIAEGIALKDDKAFKVLQEYDVTGIYIANNENLDDIKILLHKQDKIFHF